MVHREAERRIVAALESSPPRIPVVVGTCGTGRTTVLRQVAARDRTATYLDLERAVSTPERLAQLVDDLHDQPPRGTPQSAREAFDRVLEHWRLLRPSGPTTFLLDEVLSLRTFESFPGLRHALLDLTGALAASPNRFVLSSRYPARTHEWLQEIAGPFEIISLPRLTATELLPLLPSRPSASAEQEAAIARGLEAVSHGRLRCAVALAGLVTTGTLDDVTSALKVVWAPRGELTMWCEARCESRLQRTRGYGTLKALLELLADEEPLTLSELAERVQRSMAATKTYLTWLQNIDLIVPAGRFYAFEDPMLRLWVRLYCRPVPPAEEQVAREVRAYAERCLARADDPVLLASAAVARRRSGIIEID